jgi:hypothetical protein
VSNLASWSPEAAHVVAVEVWDERTGVRVDEDSEDARALWRVESAEALELEDHDRPGHQEALYELLTQLGENGRIGGDELART